jgi:pyroglutamyl-peptidase
MILLTGFEPFTTGEGLILTHNPTADIVARVAEKLPHIRHAVLPVSFQATRRALVKQFEALRPRIWIGLGYAPHRTTLDIETLAVNMEHATRGDNDGERPWMREIISGAPAAYRTRLDVEQAIRVLEQNGVKAAPCFHAGTFLCNQTFFLGCHRCETGGELELGAFIHVPPMDDYSNFEAGLSGLISVLSSR